MPGIVGDAWHGRGRGLIQLGRLLLIVTPVTRVTLSVGVFALQRDRRYVVITLIVLIVLLYSVFGPYLRRATATTRAQGLRVSLPPGRNRIVRYPKRRRRRGVVAEWWSP